MDGVEEEFPLEGLAMRLGLTRGGVRADEDFAVVEGDDVGGRGIVEEFAMHAADGGIVHDGEFQRAACQQGGGFRAGVGKDEGQGLFRAALQGEEIEEGISLMIVNLHQPLGRSVHDLRSVSALRSAQFPGSP